MLKWCEDFRVNKVIWCSVVGELENLYVLGEVIIGYG